MLPTYRDIDSVPRVAPGVEPRQRPAAQEVKPLAEKTEDACYHRFHMARVTAELVRPCVAGPKWGGYDLEMLQIAFLARAVQTRLPYVHFCTTNYCLRNRNSCRPPRGGAKFCHAYDPVVNRFRVRLLAEVLLPVAEATSPMLLRDL